MSEMRAPYRMRLAMSRPSESVPSQCAADGGSRRELSVCASGSYGARSGASTAHTANAVISASARTLSGSRRIGARLATLDPRIEPVVRDVDDQVRDRIDDGREQGHAEYSREVEAHRRCGRVAAKPGPAEDRFGQHRTR